MSSSRSIYRGPHQKLVLAFDVGTTYSGISYSVLDPGQVPEIKGVTRFPAHQQISGASKIPTIMYYDRYGEVSAVGAEAMREGIYETAEDEMWTKTEWFKLHLRPKTEPSRHIANEIPSLPLNKTATEVLGDFLKYLFDCASSYIQDTHTNGPELWASVEKDIDYVLSHPNGWGGIQQTQMRQAAVQAGLIPDTTKGHARISFVTEGEASLHFSIQNGLPSGAMKEGDGVVIVDAGGGTIDVSAYSRNTKEVKDSFEEIAAPQCHFYGSVFVTIHARFFIEKLLGDSTFIEDLDHIVRCFDKTNKLRFQNIDESQFIKFGSIRDNDEAYGIRYGQLKLQGADVANFFEPSVKCIVNAVIEQRKSAHKSISHVVLVGGFAANDWLYKKVLESLKPFGLNILRPDNHVNKAVSDGAISFYLDPVRTVHKRPVYNHPILDHPALDHPILDHPVRTRVLKTVYGDFCHTSYDSSHPGHMRRRDNMFMNAAFLTKADTLSTTDVVDKVDALNEEIFQASALFGEMLQPGRTRENVTGAFENAKWMLGEQMASILVAESVNLPKEVNPLLFQVVSQIAITTWCKFVIFSWKPGDTTVEDFLAAIYSEIRQFEDQAVSGVWRSITRAHLRLSSDGWTENLMNGLLSVLAIAGWSTREPDQQHQFERCLLPVFKGVQDVRKALGEDVTSMDMEVAIIDPGEAFDPTYMEDGYGYASASSGSGKETPEMVSATTGLGLRKVSMKRTSKGRVSHSEMVVLPKVVLEGTVKEAMDPAPPPVSRLRKEPKRHGDRPGTGGGGGG